MTETDLPLAGLRVLSVEQYGAGPFCTQHLADIGAEVIKIETPQSGGDYARYVGPHFIDSADEDDTSRSLFFQSLNRNKRSFALDLASAQGREILHRLVESAEVVVHNLRGDVPAKLGLRYEDLAATNASIVCAHLTGYGRNNERECWPGFDYLMQAEAGYFSVTGEPGSPPTRMGLSIVDYMAGVTTAFGILAAVMQARRTGVGRNVDVSLFDTAVFNLNYLAGWYLNCGQAQGREARSAHPSITPCALYRTGDGWIFLMCNKEKFWPALCEIIGHPEWSQNDDRFTTFAERLENRDLITELLDEALSQKTTAQWMELFAGRVPAAPLMDVGQALDNPFLRERGRVQSMHHASGDSFNMLATPLQFQDTPMPDKPAPELGQDTHELLSEMGLNPQQIAQLEQAGVINCGRDNNP